MVRRETSYRPSGIEDTQILVGNGPEYTVGDGDLYGADAWPGGIVPSDGTIEWGSRSARVSAWAGLGLIVSVVGLCATLTGLFAPEGAAVGVLGLLISIRGMFASGRPGMTGRGVSGVAALIALATVALAVLAIRGRLSWLDSRTDEVTTWHAWLVDHWSWLGRW